MIGFDNYKRTNFIMKIFDLYYTIFNTRTKRIVFNSCSAFVVGIGIASAGLFITRNLHIQNGVGGLETSAVPEFNESDFEETVIAENELSENLAEAIIDDIENLEVAPTGEDSLDMAAAVLEQDLGSEAQLELYYQKRFLQYECHTHLIFLYHQQQHYCHFSLCHQLKVQVF